MILIETRMNALRLAESKTKQPKKGCLGRLEGVCADFKNPTRNGRLYPLELWKKVFDDALFKESLENKTLFGELDHPEDRFEPLIAEACVVMTDYDIDEKNGLIYGGFDILDTPKGRILKSIVDYGSVVGVSSRGQGDIVESADGERVDEDTYEFACFDVVSTPAVEKARQSVMESVKRIKNQTFSESIKQQIKDAETVADLNIIRSVVRASKLNDSDIDSLVESIEDKCKTLQSAGETILTESNAESSCKCEVGSAKTIRDNKRLYRCIKNLKEQVSAYKHRESRYIDTIESNEDMISVLRHRIGKLESMQKALKDKHNRVTESFDRKLSRTDNKIDSFEREIDELKERNSKLNEQLRVKNNELKNSSIKLSETERELQEKLSKSSERVSYLENQLNTMADKHQSDIDSLDNEVEDYTRLINEAQSRIETSNSTIKQLKEELMSTENSLKSSQGRNKQLVDGIKKYQESYLKKVSVVAGVNPESLKSSISHDTTPQQIDKLVEALRDRIDRHNKIGISKDSIDLSGDFVVGTNRKETEESVEDNKLVNFLNTVQGSL